MSKFVISFVIAFGLLASSVSATDIKNEDVEGPAITLEDESSISNSASARAVSSGKGTLTGSNPLGLKPRASASTTVNSGTAYFLKAKVNSNNNGTSTSSTGWHSLNNTSKVSTSKLVASTEKATFHGYHQLKKKKTSSLETANTTLKF
ncbi:hypothetical protein [Niallia sp. BSM11]|uniref:hypothetical protein n=1 Tax=Niallia sp. BSM11 TaxID=3391576 RepID=UPI003984F490